MKPKHHPLTQTQALGSSNSVVGPDSEIFTQRCTFQITSPGLGSAAGCKEAGAHKCSLTLLSTIQRESPPGPQAQLRTARLLPVSQSFRVRNKLPSPLLPPPDSTAAAPGLVPPWPVPSKAPGWLERIQPLAELFLVQLRASLVQPWVSPVWVSG